MLFVDKTLAVPFYIDAFLVLQEPLFRNPYVRIVKFLWEPKNKHVLSGVVDQTHKVWFLGSDRIFLNNIINNILDYGV